MVLRSLEAWIWIVGLAGLALLAPYLDGTVNLCIPSLFGAEACPGCGLGKSIGLLARGDFTASWSAHPLGIPSVVFISRRIIQLARQDRAQQSKESKHG